jgi:hypothetical protein
MSQLRRLIGITAGFALLFTMALGASAANSDDAVVEITALQNAGLSASITAVTFDDVPYSFTDTTRTGQFVITALDNRGTAAGWNIVLSASDFTNDGDTRSFPAEQLSLAAGTIVTNTGNSDVASPHQQTFPVVEASETGAKIWNAAAGFGDGQYTLTSVGTLIVPGGTLVDTYSSSVTVSITTGP